MGVVIINGPLTKKQVKIAREEHDVYIKITADIEQNIIAIGGEYHADAENILVKNYGSKNSNIWGGGYKIDDKIFLTNALLNFKPNLDNSSGEILDPVIRNKFLKLAKKVLKNIESLYELST